MAKSVFSKNKEKKKKQKKKLDCTVQGTLLQNPHARRDCMTDGWTDGRKNNVARTLLLRGGHKASLVKFHEVVKEERQVEK